MFVPSRYSGDGDSPSPRGDPPSWPRYVMWVAVLAGLWVITQPRNKVGNPRVVRRDSEEAALYPSSFRGDWDYACVGKSPTFNAALNRAIEYARKHGGLRAVTHVIDLVEEGAVPRGGDLPVYFRDDE